MENLPEFGTDQDSYYPSHSHGSALTPEHFEGGEFREKQSILVDGGDNFGVSALHFDNHEELVWMGNHGGHVTSYYRSDLHKYTSFQVHATQEIRQLSSIDAGLLALTQGSLRCQARRGIPLFTHKSSSLQDMQCFLQTSPTTLVLGGMQCNMVEFDLMNAKETRLVDVGESGCAILRLHPRFLCAGDAGGTIKLRDPVTLREEHRLVAHSGSLSDFDVHGNLLVTCGFSKRHSGLVVDRFLMVYDLRMLRAVSPLQVVPEPFLLRFLPTFSSRLALVSAMGQLQVLDTAALSSPSLNLYQVNSEGAMCTALDVSSSCQFLAVGDQGGYLHTFTSSTNPCFNSFSRATEFPDRVDSHPSIPFEDYVTPFSSVPMPFPNGPFLSDWPEQYCRKTYRKALPIDPEILRNMRMVGTVGYAPNPGKRRRNQVPYSLEKRIPRGRKTAESSPAKIDENLNSNVPRRYRYLELRYAKGGLEDEDFGAYNDTTFCGLDNTLPNSYSNALLQLLYFTPELRKALMSHLCSREYCLACELGFLFHMLSLGQSAFPAQPANFLRAVRTLSEPSALGLLLPDQSDSKQREKLPRLIQSWNRFMLQQINVELGGLKPDGLTVALVEEILDYKEPQVPPLEGEEQKQDKDVKEDLKEDVEIREKSRNTCSVITELCGMQQLHTNRCTRCYTESSKESTLLVTNLAYPDSEGSSPPLVSFEDVLKRSLSRDTTTPAWCDKCQKYQPTLQSRRALTLPPLLVLNCGNDNAQDVHFWRVQLLALELTDDELGPVRVEKAPVVAEVENKSGIKPCRYGANCARPNCRFWHSPISVLSSEAKIWDMKLGPSWVPQTLAMRLKDGQMECQRSHENELADWAQYRLTAMVCLTDDPKKVEKRNLVACTYVGADQTASEASSELDWIILNDFCVTGITEQEALWFKAEYKLPCILLYSKQEIPPKTPEKSKPAPELMPNPITVDVFKEDKSLAQKSVGKQRISFLPLATDEIPGKGDLVAMDAEFVTLNQEEAELRSDGKMSTIKPSQMSVARITVIRGQGQLEGLPFIDDYIATQDQVVDYLTQFSGIQPGDLDITSSSKHLTTLKSTYLKLRFLLDNGVKFVGHGLKNDFRVINLVIPSSQVIDTVLLFHLPNQRMVSLRFLAWHFLGLKIQSVTHDSVEDARTALKLYRRYQELVAEGEERFQDALKELYSVGRQWKWTVPGMQEE